MYDERKAESEKLLEESKCKREKLLDVMERIQERIKELKAETRSSGSTRTQKNRHALQYALIRCT